MAAPSGSGPETGTRDRSAPPRARREPPNGATTPCWAWNSPCRLPAGR